MRAYKFISFAALALVLFFQNTAYTGCTKPLEDTTIDSTITPPPSSPPVQDTISLVKKLEVLTSLFPDYIPKKHRTYYFSYDNQKRLTQVGIKDYLMTVSDTFTTRFEYTGTNRLPARIIMPDFLKTSIPGQPSYDTTWFYYFADGKLKKDSSNELFYNSATFTLVRRPLYRNYFFPNVTTSIVDWFWTISALEKPTFLRRDSTILRASGEPESIKAQYVQEPAAGLGSYALAHGFRFSDVVNPLSKLNISGTPFSLIYNNVKNELLGNYAHPLVHRGNGFADYLDFISPVLPNIFFIGGYNKFNEMVSSSAAEFSFEITPWTLRPSYPSEVKVTMSTSVAGDKYIYRYLY